MGFKRRPQISATFLDKNLISFSTFPYALCNMTFTNKLLVKGQNKKKNFTALFTNMRILKFKSHLPIAFFVAVNHLNGPLRKKNFTLTGSKGHGF